MQQGEPLTMTRAEWRKADPDTKAVEGGQHWLLVRRDGAQVGFHGASGKMMFADLPPSSSVAGMSFFAAACATV